jgi:GntR family transcriptional regulator
MNILKSTENNKMPLYFQLEQIIKSKIITEYFASGEQIPTEKEICRTYGVSSITARQAILNLVNQGLLTRTPGKGTFVTDEIKNIKTFQLSGRIGDLMPDGVTAQRVKVLEIVKSKAPRKILAILNIAEDQELVMIRRVRSVDNIPVSYTINFLPLEIGEKIQKEQLCKYPMLKILRDQLEIPLKSGKQYIEAIVSDHDISTALAVSICSPLLYIETTMFARQKKPVEFVQTFIRADRYRYAVKLTVGKGPRNEIRVNRKIEGK